MITAITLIRRHADIALMLRYLIIALFRCRRHYFAFHCCCHGFVAMPLRQRAFAFHRFAASTPTFFRA